MKRLQQAVLLLPLFILVGCADVTNPSPQRLAAHLIDEEILQIKNQIDRHSSELPGDRMRWSASSVKVNEDLYNRLDDLFHQRQLLAKDLGKMNEFNPRTATTSSTVVEQNLTKKKE